MTRSVFDLPSRLRRTYLAAIQLMDEQSSDPDSVLVRDVDIASVTLHQVAETRLHLIDLGSDLLEVRQNGEHVCVLGPEPAVTP